MAEAAKHAHNSCRSRELADSLTDFADNLEELSQRFEHIRLLQAAGKPVNLQEAYQILETYRRTMGYQRRADPELWDLLDDT